MPNYRQPSAALRRAQPRPSHNSRSSATVGALVDRGGDVLGGAANLEDAVGELGRLVAVSTTESGGSDVPLTIARCS